MKHETISAVVAAAIAISLGVLIWVLANSASFGSKDAVVSEYVQSLSSQGGVGGVCDVAGGGMGGASQ